MKSFFKRLITAIILFLLTISSINANNYKPQLYNYYVKGDMVKFEEVINKMKRDDLKEKDITFQKKLLQAQYGLISYYLGANKNNQAYSEINDAEKRLAYLFRNSKRDATLYALRSSFYGFRLIIKPFSSFYIAPRIFSDMKKAKSIDPLNKDYLFLYANSTYYSPSILGGSKTEGLSTYSQLSNLLVNQNIKASSEWFSLMCLTAHGIALVDAKKYDQAIRLYEKILTKEPSYGWVEKELLPRARKKLNSKEFSNKKGN